MYDPDDGKKHVFDAIVCNWRLDLLKDQNNCSIYRMQFFITPCFCRRCWLWRGWRRRNYAGFVARSLLDCHQFVFWRERSRSTAVGFVWRVHSDVCAKNCRRLSWNWSASGVASHDCRYWDPSKLLYPLSLIFVVRFKVTDSLHAILTATRKPNDPITGKSPREGPFV